MAAAPGLSPAAARESGPRVGVHLGLAEALAAVPELRAAWDDAWAAGAHPRGAAVVQAAVDCRRAGLRRPLSQSLLRELHRPYLLARGHDLQTEPFSEAITWACGPAHAPGSLLTGDHIQGYRAYAPLLTTPHPEPHPHPVPEHLWRTLLARATPEDAYDMGLLAHQQRHPRRAAEALTRAGLGRVPGADYLLALTIGDAGRPHRAAADLAGIVRRRQNRLGPHHPDTLAARHQLAHFTAEAGNPHAAAARFAALAADAAAVLGPDHPDTLAARHALAHCTGQAGAPAEAARQLERLLADLLRVQRPQDPAVLATRRGLLWYRGGDPSRTTIQLTELLADTLHYLGPDNPHTLAVRSTQATFTSRTGRTTEAAAAWQTLVADRARVLGPDHPHTIHTRLEWAHALATANRPTEARTLLTHTLTAPHPLLEPGHRHLRRARDLLTTLPTDNT
ncbi:tetratricopeptide repeat protein [Streptomyces sp. NPDC047014]|uniref:tetratricopeptide repeat protein n=1 Tax=Streptomyces sp. NPDC047014 TaxID=3155736 RepID=UPI0033C9D1FD